MACDKGTRVQVENFQVAMKLQGVEVDLDEVECMIANMIYKVSENREWEEEIGGCSYIQSGTEGWKAYDLLTLRHLFVSLSLSFFPY